MNNEWAAREQKKTRWIEGREKGEKLGGHAWVTLDIAWPRKMENGKGEAYTHPSTHALRPKGSRGKLVSSEL